MKISDDELNLLSRLWPLYFERFGHAYKIVDDNDKSLYKNQIRALMIIGNRGQMTSSELGKAIFMSKSSITTLVDSLIDKDLVTKTADCNDRRKCCLSLTDMGSLHREEKFNLLNIELRKILSPLSEEDLDELFTSLQTVKDIFKKIK